MNKIVPLVGVAPSFVVGVDDGYNVIKVVLPDGRKFSIPSRVRAGELDAVALSERAVVAAAAYDTDGQRYCAGNVSSPEETTNDEYHFSANSRVLVHHAMHVAGLGGRNVKIVNGLPLGWYYRLAEGAQKNEENIELKKKNLQVPVIPVDKHTRPVTIVDHAVLSQAVAAFWDFAIIAEGGEFHGFDPDIYDASVAIVDIGGRTTDIAHLERGTLKANVSGSIDAGVLHARQALRALISTRFRPEAATEANLDSAIQRKTIKIFGEDKDVAGLVSKSVEQIVHRIASELKTKLGTGMTLDQVLFVGGGSELLREHIGNWFPKNGRIADDPSFANARGMAKYMMGMTVLGSEAA